MALNPNYVPLTPLWEVFTDKDLLTLLSDGYVKFYIDTARTVGKPVYQLTGSPPNYSYTQYGFLDTDGSWRVNMNLQGAFDQVIYGYPLDEFGEVQLYFADFYNADGVYQFSREGFPNFFVAGGSLTNPVNINYIPDGQFRLHTDIPSTSTLLIGEVREPITNVAFGGWTFERPVASTARDFVTFQRIGSFVTNPLKSPRYAIEIMCQAPHAGDTYKDLRVKFDDVNKFSSDDVMFTFGITGKVVSGGDIDVELIIIKNFGTGGDTTEEIDLTTFTLTNTFTPFYFSFSFGANTGKIIGALNDDFVQLAIRMPSDELFDIEFTDVLLTPGNVIAPTFNDTTTREFIYQSLFDDVNLPKTNGGDIGLPLVLTKAGLRFDSSQVGFIFASGSLSAPFGFLQGDGSKYDSILNSSDGIPYSRLASVYTFNIVESSIPMSIHTFGSGYDFITCDILSNLDIKFSTNQKGAASVPVDGANPTGFTFRSNHTGQIDITASGKLADANKFYIISDNIGIVTAPDVGTITIGFSQNINSPAARSVITATIGAIAAGQYFAFSAGNGLSPEQVILVWFKVDGIGTIPSYPSATATIEIDLFTGTSSRDEAKIVSDSISGRQVAQITTVAASAIPQSAYFNFSTTTQSYYTWVNKGGAGVDPAIPGKIGIEIPLTGSETKDQVTSAVASALNLRFFATPDLRGLFLKGYDGSATNDLGAPFRYATNSVMNGNTIGSREYSNNISHNHIVTNTNTIFTKALSETTPDTDALNTDNGSPFLITQTASYQGDSESRPENIYVNYVVKY